MAAALACEAILDGEIVHFDAAGKPQFYDLLRRRSPQYFVAFDLLWLRGRNLRMVPLIERKRRLARLVRGASPAPLVYADFVEGNGTRLFQLACEEDLEGIVAKRKDGLYTPEETSWVKIRNPRYSQMEGRLKLFEKQVQRTTAGLAAIHGAPIQTTHLNRASKYQTTQKPASFLFFLFSVCYFCRPAIDFHGGLHS